MDTTFNAFERLSGASDMAPPSGFDSSLPHGTEAKLRRADPRLHLRNSPHAQRDWELDVRTLCAERADDWAHRAAHSDPVLAQTRLEHLCGLHAEIGRCIWEYHGEMRGHCLHVFAGTRLVAVVDSVTRTAYVSDTELTRPMARVSAQLRPSAASGKPPVAFSEWQVFDLLWWFGLHSNDAVLNMPGWFANSAFVLKRFPAVSPALLGTRHLAILYLFGAGPLTYGDLWHTLDATDRGHLCADLAALHYTGCLGRAAAAVGRSATH